MEMAPAEIAEGIEKLNTTAGALLRAMEPRNAAEWEAMEKLTAAHKQLRTIDTGILRQLGLDS